MKPPRCSRPRDGPKKSQWWRSRRRQAFRAASLPRSMRLNHLAAGFVTTCDHKFKHACWVLFAFSRNWDQDWFRFLVCARGEHLKLRWLCGFLLIAMSRPSGLNRTHTSTGLVAPNKTALEVRFALCQSSRTGEPGVRRPSFPPKTRVDFLRFPENRVGIRVSWPKETLAPRPWSLKSIGPFGSGDSAIGESALDHHMNLCVQWNVSPLFRGFTQCSSHVYRPFDQSEFQPVSRTVQSKAVENHLADVGAGHGVPDRRSGRSSD